MSIYDLEAATDDGDIVVLRLEGCLDDDAGVALIGAARVAVTGPTRRIEIVLDGLDSFTPGGIAALAACARLHDKVPDGIGLLASGGVGRQALLAACQAGAAIG